MLKKTFLIAILFMIITGIFAQTETIEPKIEAVIKKDQIEVTYNIPEGYHQTLQKDYFFVEAEEAEGITFKPTIYPEGKKKDDGNIEYHGTVTLIKKFTIDDNYKLDKINIYAGYQICLDTGACLFPNEKEFSLPISSEPFSSEPVDLLTILKYLLMAFVGGLILNIMPCVLPVLSIKAMSIVKQSQQNRKQIFKSSIAYTAGIIVSFIVLALIIVILKMSGEMVGWGFQFQSAGFVCALLILIFVFALSLFDVFIIRMPGMTAATQASSKGGLTGSFLSGIFAVLLATPCTAPLLGTALGFAFSQPPAMIFGIFILIGIGLAFPFILLGIWPKAIKAIPKPGEWMNVFKEAMGFLLFLTALYLLRSLYFLVGGAKLISVLLYLIILGFSAWIYGRFARPEFSKRKQWTATIIAIFIAVIGGFLTLNFTGDGMQNELDFNLHEGWQRFSPELVESYRNEKKPVFIDFSAEWCLTCKTNETTVLFTKDVREAFSEKNVQLLVGDNTRKDDIIAQWLQKFGRAGVPLYVFYMPDKEVPITLPELITKEMVLNMLKKLDEE